MRALADFIVKNRILFFVIFAVAVVLSVFGIPRVEVEYDIATYLPSDTDTAKALEIMNEEFVTHGSATVMIKNIPYDAASKLNADIAAVDGVKSVPFSDGAEHYKSGCAKFAITFDGKSSDERAAAAYDRVVALLNDSGYEYVVPQPLNDSYADTLANEMVIILAISAAVILLVLLFTSKSFAEVIAFPIVFIVAAALNMGTNFLLGKISFVSNTVCIILQLALAIDYSIILCHRFTEEKEKSPDRDAAQAMSAALAKAIPEISSSSLTTISGLVALMFMQLGLGFDLGIVLTKSIVCSLLTVFFLMPGLLMLLSKPMSKTRHRNFVPKLRFWGKGVIKARYVLLPVFVVLFCLGAALSQNVEYVYSTEAISTSRPTATRTAQTETESIFGYDNTFVILVPKGDSEKERLVLNKVKSDDMINSALGMAGIEIADGLYVTDSVTYKDVAALTGLDDEVVKLLLIAYARDNGELWAAVGNAEAYSVPMVDLMHYVLDHGELLGELSDADRAKLTALGEMLKDGEEQLVGEKYSRLVFNINGAVEGSDTFALIDRLVPIVKDIYPDAIFAGSSMSCYDLNASFSFDVVLITALTIAFVFIILAFTFRSYGIPVVLVLVIQGAIFINFAFPVITGGNLFFFTYLIVSAIQMGATIDYAILLTNRYRQLKSSRPKREAMIGAVSGAFPTVFTSGTIMSVAGFLIGGLTSDPLIASIGTCLGRGTLISILCVLTVLPALLYTLDPALEKTVLRRRPRAKNIRMPNPSVPPDMSV